MTDTSFLQLTYASLQVLAALNNTYGVFVVYNFVANTLNIFKPFYVVIILLVI